MRSDFGKKNGERLVAIPFHESDDFKRMSTVNALVDIMSESFVAQSEDNDDYEKSYCKELEYILQFEAEKDFAMVIALTAARRIVTRFAKAQKERISNMTRITTAEHEFLNAVSQKTPSEKFMRDELLRQRFKALDCLLRREAADFKNLLRALFAHFYGFLSAVEKKDPNEKKNQTTLETFPKTYLRLNMRLYQKIFSMTTSNKRVPCVFSLATGDRDSSSTEKASPDKSSDRETAPQKRAVKETSINLRNHAKKIRLSSMEMADPLEKLF